MSLGLLPTPTVTICKVAKMVFNVAPGNFYLSQYLEYQEANGTSATVEALAGLAGGTDAAFVTLVLTNLGLADNAGASAFLTSAIAANGRGAALEAAIDALDGIAADDATYGNAVTAFNTAVTKSVTYSTNTANNSTDTAVLAAAASVDTDANGAVIPEPVSGLTLTLATTTDNATGGAGNDTIIGTVTLDTDGAAATGTTLQTADSVSAGLGTDTFSVAIDGGTTDATDVYTLAAATLTSVEEVAVRNVSTAQAVTYAGGGATKLINNSSTSPLTFSDAGSADIVVQGNGTSTLGSTTVGITSSVTDAVNIYFKDGTKGTGNVDLSDTDADWTAATIYSQGAANATGTVTVSGDTVTSLNIIADKALSASALAGFKTTGDISVTISGDAEATSTHKGVSIGTLANPVDTVDASGLTAGGLTMTLSGTDGQVKLNVTGGAGSDEITTGNNLLTTGASISGGQGTDTLIVAASNQISSALGKLYSSFETLQVESGVSVDVSQLKTNNTISSIVINGGTDAHGVTKVTAEQAAAITVETGGGTDAATTIAVADATEVGQIDTVNLTFDDGASATGTVSMKPSAGGLVLAGVENLVLNAASDKSDIILGTDASSLTSITFTGSKDQTVATTAAYVLNTNTSIDGTNASGKLAIDTSASTDSTAAVSIKGGSADDTITFDASAATDASDAIATVVSGNGDLDTIKPVINLDITDATDATPGFKIVSDAISSSDADNITIFAQTDAMTDAVTTDATWSYKYTGELTNGSGDAAGGISSGEVVAATSLANAMADGSAANAIVFRITDNLATSGTTLTTATGAFTDTNIEGVINGLVASGGTFNGTITNLDTILSGSDSALFIMDDGTHSAIMRITNTDTSTANTLTAEEIDLVGIVANITTFGDGAAGGTITW